MSERKMIEGYLVEFKKYSDSRTAFELFSPNQPDGRTYHRIEFRTPSTGGQEERVHYFFMPNDLPVDFMDIIQAEVNYQLRRMLEAVETGITTFESEFLAHFVTDSGRTIGEIVLPQIDLVCETNKLPGLLSMKKLIDNSAGKE